MQGAGHTSRTHFSPDSLPARTLHATEVRLPSLLMKSAVRYVLPTLLAIAVGTTVGMKLEHDRASSDAVRQLRKIEDAFLIIHQQYVEGTDPEKIADAAIEGMLEQLDPHSAFIPAKDLQEVQEGFQGSFGGVGIMFEVPNDTARVITTVANGPSEKVGVMPGDRIVGIDDTSAVGFDDDDIRKHLKGPEGTRVRMTVARPGVTEPITFQITRARIPIFTVDSAFMLDGQTGYIRINHFAQTTLDEFRTKMRELIAQGMQRLVLDLRDNPGGVMRSAVGMADEMLPGGKTIVSTRSRNAQYNSSERTTPGGMFEDKPVIVLINEYSASASEIVSGALQDHDRALLVGRRTFGKGLVQTQFPLSDGGVLQMTISRYYTPSGRLIQTPYTAGKGFESYYEQKYASLSSSMFDVSKYAESVPDSLQFKTDHGRTVFGGGGILPDYIVVPDTSSLLVSVSRKGLDFRFAREHFDAHEQELRTAWGEDPQQFIRGFKVDEALWNEFVAFLKAEDRVTFTSDAAAVDARKGVHLQSDLAGQRGVIEARLKGYLARNLFGSEFFYPIVMPLDPAVQEAMNLWSRAESLAMLR